MHKLATLIQGDARHIPLADESVDYCVTSPPYWGLRNYKSDGQLGVEDTPDEYVANLVTVFREVWRVLKPQATCWLVLGDCFFGSRCGPQGKTGQRHDKAHTAPPLQNRNSLPGKNLAGIPWRVAFALQQDGWILRSDIIWAKAVSFNPMYTGTCMPESVQDRPTRSHEYVFLLAKQQKYYFDQEAIKEPARNWGTRDRSNWKARNPAHNTFKPHTGGEKGNFATAGRNVRSVWTINPQPFPGAHFAVMPSKLVEPCIKAGTSEKGVCPNCGKAWVRVVERTAMEVRKGPGRAGLIVASGTASGSRTACTGTMTKAPTSKTIGWDPQCDCNAESIPAVVLDPFAGAGTVGLVAARLRRRSIGIELNPEYIKIAEKRIGADIKAGPSLWDIGKT